MPRKRKKGEQEIRILPDGRIVLVAPDEALMDLAETIATERQSENETVKRKNDDGKPNTSDETRRGPKGAEGSAAK